MVRDAWQVDSYLVIFFLTSPCFPLFPLMKKERENSKVKNTYKNTYFFLVERLQKCQFIKMFFRGDFLRLFLKPIKCF